METNQSVELDAGKLALQVLSDGEELLYADDMIAERITERVVELLTKKPEQLTRILYRIDVHEDKVTDIMKQAPVGSIASKIARLIIDRMREKVETRKKYRQYNTGTTNNDE